MQAVEARDNNNNNNAQHGANTFPLRFITDFLNIAAGANAGQQADYVDDVVKAHFYWFLVV